MPFIYRPRFRLGRATVSKTGVSIRILPGLSFRIPFTKRGNR